jgi:signal transduction histidine kinase
MPIAIAAWHYGFLAFICGTVWYLASRLADALHRREEELAATNRRLLAATEERAKHMLRTAHQLKSPLAAIHANAQVLSGGFCGEIPAAAAGVIRQISARCEMLSHEIKAMLQLANLRSSAQGPPARAVVDLAAVIRSSAAGLAPTAARRQIAVEEDLQPAPVCVVHDHAAMILDNILSNAITYSRDGGKVAVSCRATLAGGAAVAVRDAGIGISADKLPRIFDDYFRTNQAARHNQASTGLGLAIVRQAAIAGRIAVRVESAEGQGTQFFLDFPGPAEE